MDTDESSVAQLGFFLREQWREIGLPGRAALVGLLGSVILTVGLGISIVNSARSDLLAARADLIAREVDGLPELTASDRPGSAAYAIFDTAAQHQLLGGETQRIKVWSSDGRILYSDLADLVGDRFALTAPAESAFQGQIATTISDLEDPAHQEARALGQLIEVYVPRLTLDGSVGTVVEVEQRLDSLNAAMTNITRNVWTTIGVGVAVLAAFLAALGAALSRNANRRRRQAEVLLGALSRSQEAEERRIVGALHDDVGQPLYRLLYGLEGSRAKLPEGDPVADELERLEDLVRTVDGTLRSELNRLHQGLAADAGLTTAVRDLAATTELETDLDVHVRCETEPVLSAVSRTALFRAAQEAVVNVRKHAGAANIWINVDVEPSGTQITVEDDGRGMRDGEGLGLTTARERLEALGGRLRITRRRTGGTTVDAWLPEGRQS